MEDEEEQREVVALKLLLQVLLLLPPLPLPLPLLLLPLLVVEAAAAVLVEVAGLVVGAVLLPWLLLAWSCDSAAAAAAGLLWLPLMLSGGEVAF